MKIKRFLCISACCLSMAGVANAMDSGDFQVLSLQSGWVATGSIGYTFFNQMYRSDGQTPIGRFAFGKDIFVWNQMPFGLELGIQNGNDMRLKVDQETLDTLGGLPIQSTVKPMLDLLATWRSPTSCEIPVFAEVKLGAAYRRWQFNDRTSINDLSQIAGEVQAGIGYMISKNFSIDLLYQGVFGGTPDFSVNTETETSHVSHIPVQNGFLLGVSFHM